MQTCQIGERAGVHLARAFGVPRPCQRDSVLLPDDFHSVNPDDDSMARLPGHPRRGIESITYILGEVEEERDRSGGRGIIAAADVEWMTARSRIINEDTPPGDGEGRMCSVQLWASLPGNRNLTDLRQEDKSRLDIVIATAPWLPATRS